MKAKKAIAASTIATFLIVLMIFSTFAPLTTSTTSEKLNSIPNSIGEVSPLSSDITFTSGQTIDFHSTEEMEIASPNSMIVWSGIAMSFSTIFKIGFIGPGDGSIDVCDWFTITWSNPQGYIPPYCSWWEVIDAATGEALGEFHVDEAGPTDFHVDIVYPGPIPVNPGDSYYAIKKIDIIEPCEYFEVHWPAHWWPEPCSWWEIMDPETGEWTGYEFHVDWTNESCEFHIDLIIPEPYIPPFPWYEIQARQKISGISPCDYLVVEKPPEWWPEPCTWWEIIDPFTGLETGYEFHIDWTNESCEFHIDEVIPQSFIFDFPVPFFEARQKITTIRPCDWFIIVDPTFDPEPCSWWEVLDDHGAETGLEFHIDVFDGIDMFHVDEVDPDPLNIPWLSPTLTVRKKIDRIAPCVWYEIEDPSALEVCSWWRIIDPDVGDVEFHIDAVEGYMFHVDEVIGVTILPPSYEVTAEKKIDDIEECDWFWIIDPFGFSPQPCSWWEIVSPAIWAGHIFHIDSVEGSWFHIDFVDGGGPPPPPPPPPPWNVTATPYIPSLPWYMKGPYPDYAPVGMPDFDQRQWGSYFWNMSGVWTHCGPTAVANSLWWLDSEFEPNTIPPPVIIDNFPLVQSYSGGQWDDHDPLNVPFLIEYLAYMMDTDGQRTGIAHMGTDVLDMEAGITHFLSWSGVNPIGDVDGDGNVTQADANIVAAAMGTMPGVPGWDLRADIYPVTQFGPYTADNVINTLDLATVAQYMNATGLFYEHTVFEPEWDTIQVELEKCQDVVLLLMPWYWDDFAGGWYRYEEGGHYVTVAGLDGSHAGSLADPWEIVFSDPIRDNAEAGGPGNVPVPHAHAPPEPPFVTHNDAMYVSHDMYHVIFDPCPGGPLTIVDYLGGAIPPPGPYPEWRIQIEAAVITSPYLAGDHDVAVINVTTSKTGCLPMETVGQGKNVTVYATVENQGTSIETFNTTAYANANVSIVIGEQQVTLNPGENQTLSFVWDTTGVTYGNYTIEAIADTVPSETDTADNTFTDGTVLVTITGDIDGNRIVNIFDIVRMTSRYMLTKPHPNWDPNADIIEDGIINIFDVVAAAANYMQSW